MRLALIGLLSTVPLPLMAATDEDQERYSHVLTTIWMNQCPDAENQEQVKSCMGEHYQASFFVACEYAFIPSWEKLECYSRSAEYWTKTYSRR